MKGVVNKRLNKRVQGASVNAEKLNPYEVGDVVEIVEILNGDDIDGNNVWYRLDDGTFVWSGGIDGSAEMPGRTQLNIPKLTKDQLQKMTSVFNCRLRNEKSLEEGAAGLAVTDGLKNYLLTCSHVALGGKSDNLGGRVADLLNIDKRVMVLKNGECLETGIVRYAVCNGKQDFALIEVEHSYSNQLPTGEVLDNYISFKSLKKGDVTKFYSSKNDVSQSGNIIDVSSTNEIDLEYGDGSKVQFTKLLLFGSKYGNSTKSGSEKGDSGSIVFNDSFQPFALLIGGGDESSYAISLDTILSQTSTQITL